MELDVLAVGGEVNFSPANVIEEVIQNVRTICSTPKYSVPMDRLFGVNAEPVDRPTPKAIAEIQSEIIQAVRKYEPRCRVKRVTFDDYGEDGKLVATVRISINEE